MNTLELLKERRQQIIEIASKHGAYDIRIFGSVVRDADRPDSDIDILVKRREQISKWFPAGLILELENVLKRRIDVVTEKGLNPFIKEHVMKEAVTL